MPDLNFQRFGHIIHKRLLCREEKQRMKLTSYISSGKTQGQNNTPTKNYYEIEAMLKGQNHLVDKTVNSRE